MDEEHQEGKWVSGWSTLIWWESTRVSGPSKAGTECLRLYPQCVRVDFVTFVCWIHTRTHNCACRSCNSSPPCRHVFFFLGQSVVNSGCPRAAHDETIKLKCVFTSESSSHRLNHTMFWRKLPLSPLSFGLFLQEDFNLYSVMWSVIQETGVK